MLRFFFLASPELLSDSLGCCADGTGLGEGGALRSRSEIASNAAVAAAAAAGLGLETASIAAAAAAAAAALGLGSPATDRIAVCRPKCTAPSGGIAGGMWAICAGADWGTGNGSWYAPLYPVPGG